MSSVSGLNLASFEEVTMGYDPFYGIVLFNGFVLEFFLQDNYFTGVALFLITISLDYLINFLIGGLSMSSPFYLWFNQEIATTQLAEPLFFLLGILLWSFACRKFFDTHFTGTVVPHPLHKEKEWQTTLMILLDIFIRPLEAHNTRIWVHLLSLFLYNLSSVTFLWRTTSTPSGFVYAQDNTVSIVTGSFPWGSLLHLFYGYAVILFDYAIGRNFRPPKLKKLGIYMKFYFFIGLVHTLIFALVLVHLGSTFFQLLIGSIVIPIVIYIISFSTLAKSSDT